MSSDLADTVNVGSANETPLFLKNVVHRDERTAKIIKVFGSLFTLSRGGADEIQQGIAAYLHFNYPREIAAALEAAVEQYRDAAAPFRESIQALKTSWDMPARAFFAIKICEIVRRVNPGWQKVLGLIGEGLGLPDPVRGFVGAVVDPSLFENQGLAGSPAVQFRLGPTGSANCFYAAALSSPLYITYWQNDFYLSTAEPGASLDGKPIPPNFAFRFDCLDEIRVGRFRLLYRQLQLLQRWFRQGSQGVPNFNLSDDGRPTLRRPSDRTGQRMCALKPTYLAMTEGGRESRFDWQAELDVDGVRTRVSEIADIILALSSDDASGDKRTASRCLLELQNVSCNFGKRPGLRAVSGLAVGGQMIAVMGPSGCGKSTLLGTMIGTVPITSGAIKINDADLVSLVRQNPRLLGFVPQDDISFDTLTVSENLRYGARLRLPDPTKSELDSCVSNVLDEVDLADRASVVVGGVNKKTLSGGQRRRLNLALELLTPKSLLLLDEPTSGLSSGDSERILRILRARADTGALVLVVIHQPSAALFRLFDRLLLLDRGGFTAFYGDPLHARPYLEQVAPVPSASDAEEVDPGSLLAALEAPVKQVDGRSEERRMFEPEYWKARFDWFRRTHLSPTLAPELNPPPGDASLHGWFLRQVGVLFERSAKCKLRDYSSLVALLGAAIALGVIIGRILCYSSQKDSSLLRYNDLFTSFPFLSSIVALFIGMSSSITEVLRERPILRRERLLKVSLSLWLTAKFFTLVLTNFVPIMLYTLISMLLLQVPESIVSYLLYFWLISAVGVALGLAISSVPDISSAGATTLLPLVLVPQLVLAGADPFKFGDLQHLVFFKPSQGKAVPEIAAIMPSRWAYEGLIALYANHSRWTIAERVESLGTEFNNATEKAVAASKSQDVIGTMKAICPLVGNDYFGRQAKSVLEKYQTQLADQILNNDDRIAGTKSAKKTLLVRYKTIPFSNRQVGAEWYNAAALILITLVTLLLSRIMLIYAAR